MNEIKAYQIEPGMSIAEYVQAPIHTPFRRVASAVIVERREWLTVVVKFEDGGEARYDYYRTLIVSDL